MPLSKKEVGILVKKARDLHSKELGGKKYTQEMLAVDLGLGSNNRSYIGDIERGRVGISLKLAQRIIEICKLPHGYFDGMDDQSIRPDIPLVLKKLRGSRTYDEYGRYLNIDPIMLERLEKGLEDASLENDTIIDLICHKEGIEKDSFYSGEIIKSDDVNIVNGNDFMDPEIRKWIENEENYEYIMNMYNCWKTARGK